MKPTSSPSFAVILILAVLCAAVARGSIGTALQLQLGNPSGATGNPANRENYLMQRAQFAAGYNDTTRDPNWVSWDLTSADVGTLERSDFIPDPDLPAGFYVVRTEDYNGVGNIRFDRGHMCPSKDRTATLADNRVVFYMTNIVPQAADNNQGPWADFEDECRRLADLGNELLILAGPGGFGTTKIPSGLVSIPGFVWKIAVVVPLGTGSAPSRITAATRVIALKLPNMNGIRSAPWTDYVTSAAQIEADTGFRFFTELPASVADVLRQKIDGQAAAPMAPMITTQPGPQTVLVGRTVTLSVVASGSPAPTYQWIKDGVPVAGATSATLTLSNVTTAQAGQYSVMVTNGGGAVTSAAAPLTIIRRSYAGIYAGNFRSETDNSGSFALSINEDNTGEFLAYEIVAPFLGDLPAGGHYGGIAICVSRAVAVDDMGRFRLVASNHIRLHPAPSIFVPPGAPPAGPITPPASAQSDLIIEGNIADNGLISGALTSGFRLFDGVKRLSTGPASGVAGLYRAVAPNSSAQMLAIVAATGDVLFVAQSAGIIDGATGMLDNTGRVQVTTANEAPLVATFSPAGALTATLPFIVERPPATILRTQSVTPTALSGFPAKSGLADTQRVVNLSTRTTAGTGDQVAIVGFVITGLESKTVLVRAVGPALRNFGVTTALAAPRLDLIRSGTSTPSASNTGWGSPPGSSTEIAAAAARAGAFALASGSADSAILATLAPGNYTAVVSAADGRAGVGLVEVYDLSSERAAQRLVNLSTRATTGTGDATVTAGVVVSGTGPKRLLIRAIGPTLATFGVSGVLARPQLTLFSGATPIAINAGWRTSVDVAAITDATLRTGAFPLGPASTDAALIINLAPGAYTAQVTGVEGTNGNVLVEVYEVP